MSENVATEKYVKTCDSPSVVFIYFFGGHILCFAVSLVLRASYFMLLNVHMKR